MSTRDPITEWENAIEKRIGAAAIVLLLLIFTFCLIAPVASPLIKQFRRRKYVLHDDYEERAEKDMKYIRLLLWIIAMITWTFFIWCQFNYP